MARIYATPTMGEATFLIAIVTDRGEADILVNRVSSRELAVGDALWFLTPNKEDGTCSVFFCSVGFAQIKICFVSTRAEAGWTDNHPHRLRGRLH
ncbi:DUF6150 family protein [Pedobacter foliorum]|uniref:DUF6150 family protein n=1 Tax=Pedobacter foliorum TaxID=2739058 RepID=UPI003742AB5E